MAGSQIDFVGVNDITDTKTLAHLLKYDSVFGRFPGEVKASNGGITVDGDELTVLSRRTPRRSPGATSEPTW